MEDYDARWNPYRKALYWERKGDWAKAHDLVQDIETKDAAWIHAYLHRKEGDQWNAGYWYRKAGMEFYNGTLEQEWQSLWQQFT